MRPPDPKPSGCGIYTLLGLLSVLFVAGVIAFLPVLPCPAECWEPNPQLLGYTKLPGVTSAQAAEMLAWDSSFPCRLCNRRRRISLLAAWLREQPLSSQR